MLDHATGIVIGETAVVENNVSILQSVTLGGTGKTSGDRHPKIREGVMIGAGAKILGNIEVGKGAKIGAGSVVLQAIPPHTTAAGVPARIVGVRRAIRRRWIWTNTSTAPITALSTATAFECRLRSHSGELRLPVFSGGGQPCFGKLVISVTMSSIAALTSSAVTGVLSLLTVLP